MLFKTRAVTYSSIAEVKAGVPALASSTDPQVESAILKAEDLIDEIVGAQLKESKYQSVNFPRKLDCCDLNNRGTVVAGNNVTINNADYYLVSGNGVVNGQTVTNGQFILKLQDETFVVNEVSTRQCIIPFEIKSSVNDVLNIIMATVSPSALPALPVGTSIRFAGVRVSNTNTKRATDEEETTFIKELMKSQPGRDLLAKLKKFRIRNLSIL